MAPDTFDRLIIFINRIPAVDDIIGNGYYKDGLWWIKFSIKIDHPLAWHTVQELGCIVNYISIDERLPTAFYPISPAPYLNGGPEFISWIIENKEAEFLPDDMAEWLEGRMPNPVENFERWYFNVGDEDL